MFRFCGLQQKRFALRQFTISSALGTDEVFAAEMDVAVEYNSVLSASRLLTHSDLFINLSA